MPVASADAVARIGDDRTVAPMIRAAAVPRPRLWMVLNLGEPGSPKALPYLAGLARGSQPLIRRAARGATRWAYRAAPGLDDPARSTRGRAAAALVRIGSPARTALRAALGHGSRRALPYVVAALGYVGKPADVPRLQAIAAADGRSLASAACDPVRLIRAFARYHGADARFQARPAGNPRGCRRRASPSETALVPVLRVRGPIRPSIAATRFGP